MSSKPSTGDQISPKIGTRKLDERLAAFNARLLKEEEEERKRVNNVSSGSNDVSPHEAQHSSIYSKFVLNSSVNVNKGINNSYSKMKHTESNVAFDTQFKEFVEKQ